VKVIDPGHRYELGTLDGSGLPYPLQFVKRVGDKYPGNLPPAYPGTTMQEVLRALIERAQYVNRQIPCAETDAAIQLLGSALLLFEIRAKRVKGRTLDAGSIADVLSAETCPDCGHVQCLEHAETAMRPSAKDRTAA
jgi:hypothetical protein